MISKNSQSQCARATWVRSAQCSLLAGFLVAAMPAPAFAQQPDNGGSLAVQSYSIPGGPLDAVLNRFAVTAGIDVAFDATLTSGKQSSGLQGRYGVQEGLNRLLSGTGLAAERGANGSYRLVEHFTSSGSELPTLEVYGNQGTPVSTEHTGSYTTGRATIGMTERSVKETPQSISVLTRERLDDQNLSTLEEALRYTTGITVQNFGPSQYEIKARGFVSDFFLLDGSPVQDVGSSWESSGVFDTALFDRIEVLRGPAGIQHGTGEPSGTINMARKRALAETQASVALSAGSEDAYRGVVDVTGALDRQGRIRGRFVGVYDDRGSFIDHVYSENHVGYGTLEFDLTPHTTLSVGATIQDEEYRPVSGLPADANGSLIDTSRSTYLGSLWDRQKGDAERYFLELEHRLDNGGIVAVKANRLNRDTSLKKSSEGVLPADPVTGEFAIRQIAWDLDKQDDYLGAKVMSPFSLFGRSHEAVFGASYQDSTIDQQYAFGSPLYVPENVFDPNHNSPEPGFPEWSPLEASTEQKATYGQVRIDLTEALTLAMGGRITRWETTSNGTEDSGSEFTPYAGLIYGVTPAINLYTSYTGIFEPQTATRVTGEMLKPREGDQVEVGVKGAHKNGRLNWHAAVFYIEDKNRAFEDPDNPAFSIPAGKVESDGFEVEVSGEILPRWDLTAGYAYTRTEYVRDDSNEGLTFAPDTPEHNANLWTRYRFSDNRSQGWRIGAGISTVSGSYAETSDLRIEQGGYTTYSAMVGYRFNEHLDVALNGENLSDKRYYSTVRGAVKHNYFGEPRNFMLTMKYNY